MSKWSKLAGLTLGEGFLLLQSSLMLPMTAVAVRRVGVTRWQKTLARVSSKKSESKPAAYQIKVEKQKAVAIARVVRASANHGPYHGNCLEQSLVLWYLLRRSGLPSEIRFGARKDDDRLYVHSWVEFLGVKLNEEVASPHFHPFAGNAMSLEV